MAAKPVYGRLTHTPLAPQAPFFLPFEEDAWGLQRPPFSPSLARLSVELACATYNFDLDRFFLAGWCDATLQVENRLFDQVNAAHMNRQPADFIYSSLKLKHAQSMLSPSPIGDMLRGIRQFIATDTGKVVVMALPTLGDQYVIAISFMGTGRKFYDWFTNFKMACRGGMHEGFLALARQFDTNADRIQFPYIAQKLGLQSLTLADILAQCAEEKSPFKLFLTGHSQGGAAAQAYAYLLRSERGVNVKHIIGYTLAAPSTASITFEDDPAIYPIYNVINHEDFVPRMGASMRLGVDLVYVPDQIFRTSYYDYEPGEMANVIARDRLHHLMSYITDMPTLIEMLVALLRTLSAMPDRKSAQSILLMLNLQFKYLTPAMQSIGLKFEDLVRLIENQILPTYRDLCGKDVDSAHIKELAQSIELYLHDVGTDGFCTYFMQLIFSPHQITFDSPSKEGPYTAIVSRYSNALRACIWRRGEKPLQLPAPNTWYFRDFPVFPETIRRFRLSPRMLQRGIHAGSDKEALPPPEQGQPAHAQADLSPDKTDDDQTTQDK